MAVAVAVYNIQTRKYAIHWRDESGDIHKTAQNRVHLLRLIEAAAPDSIFCNNLVSWPEPLSWLSWLTRMAETIPVRFYVHDFFCLCPTIILLDRNLRFCGLPEDKTVCAACLWRNLFAAPHTPASIFVWRDAWRAFLLACETIWIPHGCTGAMVAQVYPDIRNKLLLYQKTQAVTGNSPSLPSSAPTVIAAVGTMDIHKGGAIVAELADLLRRGGEEKKMIVIGEMKVPYPSDAVFVTGRYARDALPSLLVQYGVTLCLVPSICPESYCYVVDELMALGMPVVCFDLGAQGAKCREYPRGMAVNEISAQACLEAIRTMETARKEGLAAKVTA
ncbi:MAG: glycosyltransferase [Desulfovibrionaceae bacterium]|nr:glycosyltransferase [Desulfovibrionaceae bacterium]